MSGLTTVEEGQRRGEVAAFKPAPDYDYDGARKAGLAGDGPNGHWPDTYKLPNHITFSGESKYSKPGKEGGEWREVNGKWHYKPSPWVLSQHSPEELRRYFAENERDAVLDLPMQMPSPRPQPAPSGVVPPAARSPFVGPVQRPRDQVRQQVFPDQGKTAAQLRGEEAAKPEAPWATHYSPNASFLHNLAVPFAYTGKLAGELFSAPLRLARGIPGVEAGFDWLESLKRQPQPVFANLRSPATLPGEMPDEYLQDPNAGYRPADLGIGAPGGSAVFGERVKQQVEAGRAPREQARQSVEAERYGDPRASETVVQQWLRDHLGPAGAVFDPQTGTVGQRFEDITEIPLSGLFVDALAGAKLTPGAIRGGVRGGARAIAADFLEGQPANLVGRALRTELPTVPSVGSLWNEAKGLLADPVGQGVNRGIAEFGAEMGSTPAVRTARQAQALAGQARLNEAANTAARPGMGRLAQVEQGVREQLLAEQQAARVRAERNAADRAMLAQRAQQSQPAQEVPDTRGQGVQYHGSSRPVGALDEGHYETQNIYGQGFYTTDALDVAQSYTKKGAKRAGADYRPSLYETRERQPVNFLDLDQPLSANPEMAQKFKGILESLGQEDALIYLEGESPTFANLLDEMRRGDIPADVVQEAFDSMQWAARDAGYGGWQHTGGKLTGSVSPHRVKIYFDPAQQLELLPSKSAAPEVASQDPVGVQYSGNVQYNTPQQQPSGPPASAPSTAPAPAPPAPAPPTAPAPPNAPAPPPQAPGLDIPVLSPGQIQRDMRQTLGMLERGEFQKPGLVQRFKQWLDPPDSTRIVYGGKLPKGADAAYHAQRGVIEIRRPVDGQATWHEAGHAIEKNSPLIANATPTMLNELDFLGDPGNLRPTNGPQPSWKQGMSTAYKRGEGLAEYTRLWMQYPQAAQQMAPEFTKHFEQWLDESGQVGQRMRMHQQAVQAREAATFERRWEAQQASEDMRKALEVKQRPGVTQWIADRFHPFKQARQRMEKAGQQILPTQDPYRKATMLKTQAVGETNTELSRLFLEDLAPLKNDLKKRAEFEQYLEARMFEDMMKPTPENPQGMRTGMSRFDVKAMLDKHRNNAEFQDMAQKVYDFQNAQLDYAISKGLISQEAADAMRAKWPNYVPTKRFFELAAEELPSRGAGGSGASLHAHNPIMKLHGSDREVLSPLTSIIENTANLRLQTLKNDIGRDLARMWDAHGQGTGLKLSEIDAPEGFSDLAKYNAIKVMDGDKTRWFQLDPKTYAAFEEEALGSNLLTAINQAWANFLRPGATTYNPGFALWNTVRDSAAQPYLTRVGGSARDLARPFQTGASTRIPLFPFIEGFGNQVKSWLGDSKARGIVDEWRQSPGYQDFADSLVDRTKADTAKAGFTTSPTSLPGKLWAGGKKVLSEATNASEQSTRLGHYLASKRFFRQKHPNWTDAEVAYAAAFEARDLLDFSRRGSSSAVRQLRANVVFAGSQMEGTRRALEAIAERPLQVLATGLALGTTPEMLNLMWWRDDPDFWQIPQERRDKYMFIPNPAWDGKNPDWKFIPIPRVQGVLGAFSRAPEWAAGAAKGRAPSVRQMVSTTSQDLLPANLDPTKPASAFNLAGPAVGTAAELAANYDYFRQRPIEFQGAAREHASPRLRSDQRTSALAQLIADAIYHGSGKTINMSPVMVDHAIYRLGAGTGQNLINFAIDPIIETAAQAINPKAPAYTQAERRSGGTLGERVADVMRVRYKPFRFASQDNFEARLDELMVAADEAKTAGAKMDPAQAKLLGQMKASDRKVSEWIKQLRDEKNPGKREAINMRIRRETSRPEYGTAAPGGKP